MHTNARPPPSDDAHLFQYSRPALPVASEWHLVHDAHVGGHVSHHVRKRVLLHEEARVGHQHQLVLGREVPGLHVVDFGVDADLHATCGATGRLRFVAAASWHAVMGKLCNHQRIIYAWQKEDILPLQSNKNMITTLTEAVII